MNSRGLLLKGMIFLLILGIFAIGYQTLVRSLRQTGRELYRKDDFENAIPRFMWAHRLAPWDPTASYYLGIMAIGPLDARRVPQRPDYPAAIRYFEEAESRNLQKADPGLHNLNLYSLGYSYRQLKQYDRAAETFRKQIQLYPDLSGRARFYLAVDNFSRLNRPDEIIQNLEHGIGLPDFRPWNNFAAYVLLARTAWFLNDEKEADRYASLALRFAPETPEINLQTAHLILALAKAKSGQLSPALAEYEVAESLARETGGKNTHQCSLANIYTVAGDYTKGLKIAEEKITSNAFDPKIYRDALCYVYAANAAERLGNTAQVKEYSRRYLEVTAPVAEKNIFIYRYREIAETRLKP